MRNLEHLAYVLGTDWAERAFATLQRRSEPIPKDWPGDEAEVNELALVHPQVNTMDSAERERLSGEVASLDTERDMWAAGNPDEGALTPANYVFEDRGAQPDGLASLAMKPRRKGVLLVDGSIFLNPDDGELVRMEGQLSKTPSFWTRRVEIVRWYQRIAGFRMPTALESVANVRIAGISTFRMTYDYESINGQRVGNPQPRTIARVASR